VVIQVVWLTMTGLCGFSVHWYRHCSCAVAGLFMFCGFKVQLLILWGC